MNLSELTNKIYAEGVEKGNAEAAAIVAKAKDEAAAIVAKAEKEAAEKLAAAFSLRKVVFIKNDGKIVEAKVSEEEPIVVEYIMQENQSDLMSDVYTLLENSVIKGKKLKEGELVDRNE